VGYNPSYKWINHTYPIYNWGYIPLTNRDEPPSIIYDILETLECNFLGVAVHGGAPGLFTEVDFSRADSATFCGESARNGMETLQRRGSKP